MSKYDPDTSKNHSRRFWIRVLAYAPTQTTFHARFQTTFEQYARSIVEQSRGRGQERHHLTIAEYLELRRGTTGADPLHTIAEIGLELPLEVLEHPLVVSLQRDTGELLLLDNVRTPICSYRLCFSQHYTGLVLIQQGASCW